MNRKFLITVALAIFSLGAYAQMGITSYSIYALGVNTSQNKKLSVELKTFANRDIDNLFFEIDGFYNFKPRTYHRFSLGIGVSAEPFKASDKFDALTIPAAIEIYPLQNFKKISLLFELTPEINSNGNGNLRSLWGIRYTFGE